MNKQTHFVGWGCGFFDPDNDGFADVLYVNGHVYPELERVHLDTTYREARVLFRNLGNGKFEDVSQLAGTSITTPSTGRGCAFGDFNNDGCVDVVINNQNAGPSLLKISAQNGNQWINIRLVGKKEIQALNKTYRHKDKPTNVLSFPQFSPRQLPKKGKKNEAVTLGDIVISYQYIVGEAKKDNKMLINHVSHLLIHGILHLFGYDHVSDTGAARMERLEKRIMADLGLPDPYKPETKAARKK